MGSIQNGVPPGTVAVVHATEIIGLMPMGRALEGFVGRSVISREQPQPNISRITPISASSLARLGDRKPTFGRATFTDLQDVQPEGGIALLLSDRWRNLNAPIASFDFGMIVLADATRCRPRNCGLAHFGGDRMATVTRDV
jgi:hypothetical protein